MAEVNSEVPYVNRRLTAAEANDIANKMSGGAISIVAAGDRLKLCGAKAGSGVLLFPYLTTRAGITAAVMEFYR